MKNWQNMCADGHRFSAIVHLQRAHINVSSIKPAFRKTKLACIILVQRLHSIITLSGCHSSFKCDIDFVSCHHNYIAFWYDYIACWNNNNVCWYNLSCIKGAEVCHHIHVTAIFSGVEFFVKCIYFFFFISIQFCFCLYYYSSSFF